MNKTNAIVVVVLYVALPAAMLLCARCAAPAHAQAPNGANALLAARSCYVEAEFSEPDCRAIVAAMLLRARLRGWTFERTIIAYSAIDADTARARLARSLPDGDAREFSLRENAKWHRLRAVAAAALHRRVLTPCPGATGWGGPGDELRAGQRIVVCMVHTHNWFYRGETRR
jgi:hypothetical protein